MTAKGGGQSNQETTGDGRQVRDPNKTRSKAAVCRKTCVWGAAGGQKKEKESQKGMVKKMHCGKREEGEGK